MACARSRYPYDPCETYWISEISYPEWHCDLLLQATEVKETR